MSSGFDDDASPILGRSGLPNMVFRVDAVTTPQGECVVSIVPPEVSAQDRLPAIIACVVDVSGSMGTLVQSSGGESDGFTMLDLCKHGVTTIASNLSEQDEFAIVSFGSSARTELPMTRMNDDGIRRAKDVSSSMSISGSTNLWAGLCLGLDLVHQASLKRPRCNATVFLLTDGHPDGPPPDGWMTAISKYQEKQERVYPCHMFGFGYGINSELLRDLSGATRATYAFIPDGNFIGTVFGHAAANWLTTASLGATISVSPANNNTDLRNGTVAGAASVPLPIAWDASVPLGGLRFGQSRDMIIRGVVTSGSEPPQVEVSVRLEGGAYGLVDDSIACVTTTSTHVTAPDSRVWVQRARCVLLEAVEKANEQTRVFKDQQQIISRSANVLNGMKAQCPENTQVAAIAGDMNGEVTLAFSRSDYYKKWGGHYLRSFNQAHREQLCNNFKDASLQDWGGDLFKHLRDRAADIFDMLPPPVPTGNTSYGRRSHGGSGGGGRSAPAAPVNMASYNDPRGVCFHGDCTVIALPESVPRPVRSLRRGDAVLTDEDGGTPAVVRCLVRTPCPSGEAELVRVGGPDGPLVTAWHPVRLDGSWQFPAKSGQGTALVPADAVYNLVLSRHHVALVNGVPCATLGHGITGEVISHPYFGTQDVVDDLSALPGWEEGMVEVSRVERDPVSGLVSKLA